MKAENRPVDRQSEGVLDKEIRLQKEYSEIIKRLQSLEVLDGEPVGVLIDALKERRRLIGF